MELYKKIDKILDYHNISRTKLAEKLNIKQNTFNGYFTKETQDKITPYLWKIHSLFPQISRNWLFFNEGEMFSHETIHLFSIDELETKLTKLEKENKDLQKELTDERKLNRKLTNQIIDSSDIGVFSSKQEDNKIFHNR